jgi:hypothetical protein
MRRKPLWTVMLAGILFAASGALLHLLRFGSSPALTRWVSAWGAMLASIRPWIQLTLAHISPTQLVEGVGVAWFMFVLALLLLSRPDRAEPVHRESLVRVSPVRVSPDTAPPRLFTLCQPLLELPYAGDDNAPNDSAEVSQVNGNPPGLNDGRLLVLSRIAATERGGMSYGLFVVAEYLGSTSNSDEASWRTLDVTDCQVAVLLAPDTALANERLAAPVERAVLRASHVLRHDGIRMAADVPGLVAGIMVIGNDIYVVDFGHSGAYQCRPLG